MPHDYRYLLSFWPFGLPLLLGAQSGAISMNTYRHSREPNASRIRRNTFCCVTLGYDKLLILFVIWISCSDSLFCTICGSRLLVDDKEERDMLYITLGTVDGDVKLPTGYHQFAGSKARWFDITDGLDQHEGWPPGEG